MAAQPSYESLTSDRLDAYSHFLQSCIQADATIANTALVEKLEREHSVSASTSTMSWWRGKERRAAAAMAREALIGAAAIPPGESPINAMDNTTVAPIEVAITSDIPIVGGGPIAANTVAAETRLALYQLRAIRGTPLCP